MPLSKADLQVIQTVFGKTTEELSGALSSEDEVTLGLTLPGKIYTPDEIKNIGTKNQDAWIEVGYKKMAKELKLELKEGEKDPKIIAGKLRSVIEGEMEKKYKDRSPDEQLKAAIKAKDTATDKYEILHKTYEDLQDELKDEKVNSEKFKNQTIEKDRDNNILSYYPEKMTQNKKDALLITKAALDSEEIEGTTYYKLYGDKVLDSTGQPADLQSTINKLVEDKGWIKGSGKNGKDRKPEGDGVPNNLTPNDAAKYLEKKGIEPMSTEGSELFAKLTMQAE